MSYQIKWVHQELTTSDKNRAVPNHVTRNCEYTGKGKPSSFQREHKTAQMQRIKNKMASIDSQQHWKLEATGHDLYLLSGLIIGSIYDNSTYHFKN